MSVKLPSIKVHTNHAKNTCYAACTCDKWEAWGPAKDEKMIQQNAEKHHQWHKERGK